MTTQITFRDFPPSNAVREHVEKRASKIRARWSLLSLKVTLSAPHRHHQHGNAYRVCIDMTLPGREIAISPRDGVEGHGDLYATIDDAFDDAARRLREHTRMRHEHTRARAAN
jgi:ribosomal subunit interface protein